MARHKTEYQIKMTMKNNRDGRPDLQTDRHNVLMKAVGVLQDNHGYSKHWKIQNFSNKEVIRIVSFYKNEGNSPETIANKLVHLRWLGSKVGANDISSNNSDYDIRKEVVYSDKSVHLSKGDISHLDERMQLIFESKYVFGLREEESLKIRPGIDIKHDRIELKITKGNRPRTVPIVSQEQRDLANRIQEFHAKNPDDKSMIPARNSYNAYRHQVQRAAHDMGVKGHGYRHAWAHNRFEELSGGIKPPLAGGPAYETLNDEDRSRWNHAAKIINNELGHGEGRHDITATYIGLGS